MSVKELKLEDEYNRKLYIDVLYGGLAITPIVENIGDTIFIDRNQARLLMLYLQEHLK